MVLVAGYYRNPSDPPLMHFTPIGDSDKEVLKNSGFFSTI